MIVAAGGYTMVTVVVLGRARFTAEDAAAETLTLLMASMALGWVFGPVLIGGVDETIDPTKLALLPMSSTERYVVQLAAAMTGTGPLAAATGLCVGLTIGHTRLGISLFVVPLAAICAVFLMVGAARSLAALLAIAQRSRVGRDFAVLAAAIAGGSLFTMAQLARDVGARADAFIEALGWLPLAWPARAINAARRGDEVPALAWLVASAMLTVAPPRCLDLAFAFPAAQRRAERTRTPTLQPVYLERCVHSIWCRLRPTVDLSPAVSEQPGWVRLRNRLRDRLRNGADRPAGRRQRRRRCVRHLARDVGQSGGGHKRARLRCWFIMDRSARRRARTAPYDGPATYRPAQSPLAHVVVWHRCRHLDRRMDTGAVGFDACDTDRPQCVDVRDGRFRFGACPTS